VEIVYRARDVLCMDRDHLIMKINIHRNVNVWQYTCSTLEK